MKQFFVLGALFCSSLLGWSQNQVSGTVFEDTNANGKQDRNEQGIAKVSVTNGKEVVQTDAKGHYVLPASNDMIVAVIKPENYTFPLNDKNLPQFYYIHKPEGSPKSKFTGVAPTGNLPKAVNFGLYSNKESNDFSILVFGDPQPYTKEEVDYFEKAIVKEVVNTKDAVFGMSLGDLVGNDLSLFKLYQDAIQQIGLPWFNVMGNHDLNFDTTEDKFSDETYEANFGPSNYAFNYGKVHFIVLDDILYPDPRKQTKYWGGFRPDQLDFIENDLKFVPKDHLIVLAFHIPLTEPDNDAFRDEDRETLFNLLKDFPNTLSLSAHTHIQKQDFIAGPASWELGRKHHEYNVGTTSGDWYSGVLNDQGVPVSTMRDGTPKGYAFIDFKGNTYKTRYKVAGKPDDYQMSVFAPKVLAKDKRTKSGVYINFFMGEASDTVQYRIDNGKWKPMKYVEETDPNYVADVMQWDLTETLLEGKRGSNPIKSKHLWFGKLNTKLPVGTHNIEVKATDMYGNEFTGSAIYKIEGSQF